MRYLLFLMLMWGFMTGFAQSASPGVSAIKSRMADIRKNTNWNDPAAAREANARIEELARQLTAALRAQKAQQQGGTTPDLQADPDDQEVLDGIKQEIDDFNSELWHQMMLTVRDGGSWDLAKPLREDIVQEYKDDEDPTVKNQQWLDSMTFLTINLSMPLVDLVIDQMPNYRGIKTLVITADAPLATARIPEILSKAGNFPLERLCIVNLPLAVTEIPGEVARFSTLKELQLVNNSIRTLPGFIGDMNQLTLIYLDKNPVSGIADEIIRLNKLKVLGIAQTRVSDDEINTISQALPECKLLKE